MLSEYHIGLGRKKNCMRELAAFAGARKAQIGADKVFDFSLGNPSIPAPPCVNDAIRELLELDSIEVHGYTTAAGLPSLRKAIADDFNARYGGDIRPERMYVICGAAAGLAICSKALVQPGEEAIAFAPFFTEYRVFVEGAGGVLVSVPPTAELQPDLEAFERALSEKTQMVIINTPNNPSGVVLTAETLTRLSDLLRAAEARYGHPIYLVSDEPYRELVYDGKPIPHPVNFYDDTIIDYSYSKSLSLPGERIGYLAVSSRMANGDEVYAAITGAARTCGYVNAPSLMQRVVEKCVGQTSDIAEYKINRDLLFNGLTELGFDCVFPDGAFYIFMKSPEPDAVAFSEKAKKYELILVPSNDFGVEGYVRLAYCVSSDTIRRSMPAFAQLAAEYGLQKK